MRPLVFEMRDRLRRIELSRFWQLRNAFFSLKHKLGFSSDAAWDTFEIPAAYASLLDSGGAYAQWRVRNDPRASDIAQARRLSLALAAKPAFEIVIRGEPGTAYDATLASLEAQAYPFWKLAPQPAGEADFIAYVASGDRLAPDALFALAAQIALDDRTDVVYSDEDTIDENGARSQPNFKADWSPETLRSRDYIGDLVAYRCTLFHRVGGLREEFGPASAYDLALRATEAARIAVTNLDARETPAGEMPVVVGAGGGGVLLHEAVGHGLESDFNRQGTSLYSGRVGERVASELVTIYDDGNLPDERGSVAIDDEGTPGAHKVLVENGILRGYMQDRLNAKLMGVASTGSGRRQSFRVMPQPRMCNTYMPSGTTTFEDIIASVERGIYATSFAGGQVEISKGDFVFMVAEGYLIEGGKITAPVRGATLIGNGPDAMTKVVAVGNDGRLANRSYTCGKGGQMVPVGVGMPTVKLASCTVGGSSVGTGA